MMDYFSTKVTKELSSIDLKKVEEIFVKIGKNEIKMYADNVERPTWKCKIPQNEILGLNVVIPTEKGETVGRVIYFGLVNEGAIYEKSVIVHVPSSGTVFETISSAVKIPTAEAIKKMELDISMATSLSSTISETKNKQKNKLIKDPNTLQKLLSLAKQYDVNIFESASNYKICSLKNQNKMYVFKNYLRVDLSGFNIDNQFVKKITEQEAKDNHLGKVKGQILFEQNNIVKSIEAFELCLKCLV